MNQILELIKLSLMFFLTSSNYDDSEKRLKGGMNGLGAKLVAAYSDKFIIETVCKGKKYTQVCENNLSNIKKPKIADSKKKDYTKITFYPDFKRFKMKKINEGLMNVLEKRAYDMSACTDKKVNIWFNKEKLKTKDFESYINLNCGDTIDNFDEKKLLLELPKIKFNDDIVFPIQNCNFEDFSVKIPNKPFEFLKLNYDESCLTTIKLGIDNKGFNLQ